MIELFQPEQSGPSTDWNLAGRFLDGCNIGYSDSTLELLSAQSWRLAFKLDDAEVSMLLVQSAQVPFNYPLGISFNVRGGAVCRVSVDAFVSDPERIGSVVTNPYSMYGERFLSGYQDLTCTSEQLVYERRRPKEDVVFRESFILGNEGELSFVQAITQPRKFDLSNRST